MKKRCVWCFWAESLPEYGLCRPCLELKDLVSKNFHEIEKMVKAVKLDKQNSVETRTGSNLNSMRVKFASLFGGLNQNEKMVLSLRFGLDGVEGRTLRDVGLVLRLTPARIRQIEHKALRKLDWRGMSKVITSKFHEAVKAELWKELRKEK